MSRLTIWLWLWLWLWQSIRRAGGLFNDFRGGLWRLNVVIIGSLLGCLLRILLILTFKKTKHECYPT
jgi:hypothetical protein